MKIADVVRENKDRIIKGWLEKVVKEIPEVAGYDHSIIENSVPELIDEIIAALKEHDIGYVPDHSRKHALQRSQLKVYSLEQIIREYNLLKKEIFHVTDEYDGIDRVERDAIMFTIDNAIEQAAETYFRIREEAHINARSIAEKKADDLELLDENREDFIQSITHDLNTPLSNIKGCINMLEDELEFDQVSRILRILKGSTHQAELIIKDFLDVATITPSAKLPLQKAKTNLLDQLKKEINIFKIAHARNIELQSSQEVIIAEVDSNLLMRAFNNLLSNAVRHGDGSSTITVTCNLKNNSLRITVHNFGRQIPPDALDAIFGRYYKIDEAGSGWGIGLAFVKEVAEAHGGKVSAKSNPGEGNIFELKIPLS
jgi:signal transduction histidine kinase